MNNFEVIHVENHSTAIDVVIPVFRSELDDQPLVDARTLHRFLDIDTEFRKWISRRIEEYGFQEGQDFRSFLAESSGGRRGREYHISLDMGKELAMVERNEKGRLARRYFIECEKRLQAVVPHQAATIAAQTIGTDGFHMLGAVAKGKVAHLPKSLQAGAQNHMWSQLRKAFSVSSIHDIPASQLDAARCFVAAYVWEGQWLPRQEAANDFDYPAAWIWQNNPALTAGPQRVNGHNGLFLGLKVLAPSEFKSPIWDAIRKLKAQGANTEGLEIEWRARKELMYLLSRIIEDATYRLNEHMQHAPFFPVPDSRPLLD
ncbi:antA/AntB antirepressor family protein [Pseudomonas rhizoryzae]|uniref:antA/AntB antirepressor family protein n=1 Tax=Pseudomonas rhizoryzae TaxID=2571129 RepID=UPI001EFFD461|nr:antA/AntB antirepressor family protein [Pseudomonas rhizoryzae]